MDQSKDFLGRGFAFPPKVDPVTGRFLMAEGEEDIRQAIYIILMTKMNERAMMPDFGCRLQNYIFELPDASFINSICYEMEEALTNWEPRIHEVKASVDMQQLPDGVITLNIDYVVRATNNPNNLVFPYYLEEGIGEL
jgi:phage baseplate assembly protein W